MCRGLRWVIFGVTIDMPHASSQYTLAPAQRSSDVQCSSNAAQQPASGTVTARGVLLGCSWPLHLRATCHAARAGSHAYQKFTSYHSLMHGQRSQRHPGCCQRSNAAAGHTTNALLVTCRSSTGRGLCSGAWHAAQQEWPCQLCRAGHRQSSGRCIPQPQQLCEPTQLHV